MTAAGNDSAGIKRGGWVPAAVAEEPGISLAARGLYAILACHADRAGECYPGVALLGQKCGLSKPRVIALLAELERAGVVVKLGTNRRRIYRLTGQASLTSDWFTGNEYLTPTGDESFTGNSKASLTPTLPEEHYQKNTVSPPTPTGEIGSRGTRKVRTPDLEAEAIYQLYPRKDGRPKALLAIRRAIQREGFERIQEQTSKYAAHRRQVVAQDPEQARFTPMPATWFNGERYNGEPWGPAPVRKNGQTSTLRRSYLTPDFE